MKEFNISNEEINFEIIENLANALPKLNIYGKFLNQKHYHQTFELLINSTKELETIYKFLDETLLKISKKNNFLDIGCASGEFTYFVGRRFENIVTVDTSNDALENLKISKFGNNKNLIKICGSIMEVELPHELKYDFILLSHVIYYIKPEEVEILLRKLLKQLNCHGKILIIFDEGLDREEFVKYFGANLTFREKQFNQILLNIFGIKVDQYRSKEYFRTKSINSMMHIAGICLNDVGITAEEEKLKSYLMYNNYKNGYYEINMYQKFILIENVSY